ncbi:MAG: heme-binding protein [Proteobacteria bacterium]|nr:heme-binding protein [Pseudomonadota bacterium]
MRELTLKQANQIIETALVKGQEMGFHPLTVVILDAGGHMKAMQRQEKTSIARREIAEGKAYGTLAMGFGGRELQRRTLKASPLFFGAISDATGGRMVPVPGGVLIKDADGNILGAVGISGDLSENDEICAVAGILAAGLVPDTGDPL